MWYFVDVSFDVLCNLINTIYFLATILIIDFFFFLFNWKTKMTLPYGDLHSLREKGREGDDFIIDNFLFPSLTNDITLNKTLILIHHFYNITSHHITT